MNVEERVHATRHGARGLYDGLRGHRRARRPVGAPARQAAYCRGRPLLADRRSQSCGCVRMIARFSNGSPRPHRPSWTIRLDASRAADRRTRLAVDSVPQFVLMVRPQAAVPALRRSPRAWSGSTRPSPRRVPSRPGHTPPSELGHGWPGLCRVRGERLSVSRSVEGVADVLVATGQALDGEPPQTSQSVCRRSGLLRFSPWKSASTSRPAGVGAPVPRSSLGLKLLCDAHASRGPVDREVFAGEVAAQLRLADHCGEEPVSDLCVEEPLAEGPLAVHRVQRHQVVALSNCSGGRLGRPICEYIAHRSPSSSPRTSSTTLRIR